MTSPLLVEVDSGVATLTLNRPEKLNAYTVAMGEAIVSAFRQIREDDAIRAVILTGSGRGFCAGVDLDVLKAQSAAPVGGESEPRIGEEDFVRGFPQELLEFPKPVIAAINGPAIGVGVTMTLPCDLRVAARGAKLGLTFTKLGILPGLGSTHLLPRIVGRGTALDLVLTGRIIEADEALRLGLVHRVVEPGDLLSECRGIAKALSECRPEVLAAAKRALGFGADAGMAGAISNEQRESAQLRLGRSKKE